MQKQDLILHRDHTFTYADHEREVMHVVTRLGHAYIGQERQWIVEEESENANSFIPVYKRVVRNQRVAKPRSFFLDGGIEVNTVKGLERGF